MNLLASPWGIYGFAAFRGKNNKCTTNALFPGGGGTLGIDRAIKTHNSMLVLRGPSRVVVRDLC